MDAEFFRPLFIIFNDRCAGIYNHTHRIMHRILHIIILALAMSGIRLEKHTWTNLLSIVTIACGYALHIRLVQYITTTQDTYHIAWTYFFALFVLRYVYLFLGFSEYRSIRSFLCTRYSLDTAYNLYEIGTAWFFFQRSLSVTLLIHLHQDSLVAFFPALWSSGIREWCIFIGWVCIVVATIINLWATHLIGIDTYFYKDLFVGRFLQEFSVTGPYRYFNNPMYGIGQASSYGLALIALSWEGILVSLLNQCTMYLFYVIIEKPHIKRILERQQTSYSKQTILA